MQHTLLRIWVCVLNLSAFGTQESTRKRAALQPGFLKETYLQPTARWKVLSSSDSECTAESEHLHIGRKYLSEYIHQVVDLVYPTSSGLTRPCLGRVGGRTVKQFYGDLRSLSREKCEQVSIATHTHS